MITVVGLSHRTAPIEVRERVALPKDKVPDFLRALLQQAPVGEALVVSTCNRLEIVAAARGSVAELPAVAEACVQALEQIAPGIARHTYRRTGGEAVRHLFRVASSLDSLVLGEPQILGQLKDAFDAAKEVGSIGSVLHRSVPRAIRTAKRVRSETVIGSGQVSVPSVAVDLTRQIFGELRGRTVLLVGSGEMAEAVARLLRYAGASLLVLGRNLERVQELATAVDGEPRLWHELKASLVEADVVITSTSAPSAVIDYELAASARKARRGRDQTYIDLAVPRDVDPRVNTVNGVFVYNIDDFSQVVAQTLSNRAQEAESAERIVEEETRGYERWADAEQATPTVVRLRAMLRQSLRTELDRSFRGKLKHLGREEREALEKMCEAVENRLLHVPTMKLRQAAIERDAAAFALDDLTSALEELFDLSGNAEPESPSGPQASPAPLLSSSPSAPHATDTNERWATKA